MTVPMKIAAAQNDIMESVLIKGDLGKLTPDERVRYYNEVCRSLGLNPLTKPFEFITLNGKLQLYALRACADQLRKINSVSLEIVSREVAHDILTIHVRAKLPDGRSDEDLGAVPFPETLKGEARSNAELKAVTKAKRRATLSICGLGWLDETEVESIPASAKRPVANPNVMLPLHDGKTEEIIDEVSLRPSEPHTQPAATAGSTPAPQDEPAELSAAEYCQKWDAIIQASTNAKTLGTAWNADKPTRDKIKWMDDGTFAALKQRITNAIAFLKEPA
jgi:hypothetical protein